MSDPETKIQVSSSYAHVHTIKIQSFSFFILFIFSSCLQILALNLLNSLKMQSLIEDLDSKNWVKVCESLNDARRFALYHSSLLFPIL